MIADLPREHRSRRTRRRAAGRALLAALALLAAAAADPPVSTAQPPAASDTDLPRTLERIWYRTGQQRGLLGPKRSGDLTLTPQALEFSSRKDDLIIPVDAIALISYGRMRGDVDTDWVVLSVARDGDSELVGLRDGRRLGFGQRTRELFELLVATAERLGFAQYDVPPGFEPYTELDHQFVIAVPEGWFSHHQSLAGVGGRVLWGTVVFSPERLIHPEIGASSGSSEREQARRRIASGEVTAWIVDRHQAAKGMSCEALTEKARETLRRWTRELPLFAEGIEGLDTVALEPASLDRCRAARLQARGSGGTRPVLDLHAVSDDDTLYLVGLRTIAEREQADRRRFEQGLATLKFSVAR